MKKYFANEMLFQEVAALLKEGKQVTIPVRGESMRPFLADGRDSVTLVSCIPDELSPGVVVLARENKNKRIILHRILSIHGNRLLLQGDGNGGYTETAEVQEVMGKAIVFIRKGKTYTESSLIWRIYSACWVQWLGMRRASRNIFTKAAYLGHISAGFKRKIASYCLLGLCSVGLSLGFIFASKWMIDMATGATNGRLAVGTVVLLGLVLLQLLCDAADSWTSVRIQIGVGNKLRYNLFTRLLQSHWNEMEKFHSGDVMNRIEQDTSVVTGILTVSLPSFFILGMQLLAAFTVFCFLDARLPWIVAGIIPVCLLAGRFYLKRMHRYTDKIRKTDSRIQSIMQESLQQRPIVKALELGGLYASRLKRQQKTLQTRLMRRTRFSIITHTYVSVAFAAGYMTAFLWGTVCLSNGIITFGTMAAFLQLVGKVQGPILNMARLIPSLSEAITSINRLYELENVPAETKSHPILFTETPDINIEHVTFRYESNSRPIFNDFSYKFKAGSKVAVIGTTGRGKTTLIRLLLALITPEKGSVSLSNAQMSIPASPDTRCNFTYVPQGNSLFSGTIRENLLMGNPHASEEDLYRALHTAVADFVFSLPDGIETVIGEQGNGLSEGQAQRIAIARALLRNSHIFLLDEATSALDEATELTLINNLNREFAGKTFIFITHHTAISAKCGQILQIET